MSVFKASSYNFWIPTTTGGLLFNANSGGVLAIDGEHANALKVALCSPSSEIAVESLPPDVLENLLLGKFVVANEHEELLEIRERFSKAREETPQVLTITTTLDCNLGCYYCYEERSSDSLDRRDLDGLIDYAAASLNISGKKRLHVDWYGGEPMLNKPFLELASDALQLLCAQRNVTYHSSIISNGTNWPTDVKAFLKRHCVRQVQITFDGLKVAHDKRRFFRDKASRATSSSFEQAVALVGELLDYVHVDVRFNVDKGNLGDLVPFFEFAKDEGWFDRKFPAIIQPARISAYTERAGFLRKDEISPAEFDQIRRGLALHFSEVAQVQEAEAPDGFPHPKTSVCAALAKHSSVIGADRRTYRCGLQVSEPERATGLVQRKLFKGIPVLTEFDRQARAESSWWDGFDPTYLPTCSQCSFLPICWGGCPKKHLDRDQVALAEQGLYWRKNLARLVANYLGRTCDPDFEFLEADQFRHGSGTKTAFCSAAVNDMAGGLQNSTCSASL